MVELLILYDLLVSTYVQLVTTIQYVLQYQECPFVLCASNLQAK